MGTRAKPRRDHPPREQVCVAPLQVNQVPVIWHNSVVLPKAQDDDAPVTFEIPTVGEEHVPIAKCNHAANDGCFTAPSEGGEDLQPNSGILQQV